MIFTIRNKLATFVGYFEDTKDVKRSVERKGVVARVTVDINRQDSCLEYF